MELFLEAVSETITKWLKKNACEVGKFLISNLASKMETSQTNGDSEITEESHVNKEELDKMNRKPIQESNMVILLYCLRTNIIAFPLICYNIKLSLSLHYSH